MKILHHPQVADIELSSVLYALSDPTRLGIVAESARSGEQPCSHFHARVVKSTMSHHIRTLREAGVIRVRVQGTQHFITLRSEDLEERFPGLLQPLLQAAALTSTESAE
ncbi:helix-turn-helix transcriptional regulator [Paenibacillus sp. RRE4]|uniref:ArsR/SmtB family transcription factor n=1 Tax=Paenibacillus TaxID=44249 RepID=UPI0011A2639C|nr:MULTISPECIES: helix-turn-helix transcriptional regulator [Paenibacillus]MCM3136172.1 ArsR family transcriptional regulator [Paenibacillus polysaccharolyticus]MDT0121011.1 helix-turn-helix transcriptional regulator [Paenibacillus sp. RRE4]